jgi:hypothetical protein
VHLHLQTDKTRDYFLVTLSSTEAEDQGTKSRPRHIQWPGQIQFYSLPWQGSELRILRFLFIFTVLRDGAESHHAECKHVERHSAESQHVDASQ